ncbi:MAG: AraC family transcriptional regulator ligand-binding domain-containing protein [Litoreibacter sp.]
MKSTAALSRSDQFLVVASIARDLPDFCASLGVDIETVAAPLEIDTSTFQDFEKRISFDRFCRLLDILATIVSDDALGMRYGEYYKHGSSGAFGLGLRAAPTLKDMLNFYSKYVTILVDLDHFDLFIEKDRFTVDWRCSPLITQSAQFVDFVTFAFIRHLQHFAGHPVTPLETKLERRKPNNISLHKKAFPRKLSFETASNTLVYTSEILNCISPNADPITFEFMSQKCNDVLTSLERKKDIVTVVKEDLVQNLRTAAHSIENVANRCGMSERTLQRRLGEFGTNYAELFDQTRDELSLRMLQDRQMSLSEISHQLGYSSQSAYTRAVKRLHGVSPGVLRARTP